MAILAYQIAYWGWQYMEKEEIKSEKTGMLIDVFGVFCWKEEREKKRG